MVDITEVAKRDLKGMLTKLKKKLGKCMLFDASYYETNVLISMIDREIKRREKEEIINEILSPNL